MLPFDFNRAIKRFFLPMAFNVPLVMNNIVKIHKGLLIAMLISPRGFGQLPIFNQGGFEWILDVLYHISLNNVQIVS